MPKNEASAVGKPAYTSGQRMTRDLHDIFGEDGLLSRAIPGYRLRTQQLEMAQAVAAAIENTSILIAEAGTGTGKTFAYLVAALLSGGKVIISTGTKTLQDQLFDRDIPLVRSVLAAPVTVALLKGRANYVCHYHLERAKADGRFLTRDDTVHLARIDSYSRTSVSGDRSALAEVPEELLDIPDGFQRTVHPLEQMVAFAEEEAELNQRALRGASD